MTEAILNSTDAAVFASVFGIWDLIAAQSEPWLSAAFVLAASLFCYGLSMGYVQASRGEIARMVLALCLAHTLVTSGSSEQGLNGRLYRTITGVPESIAKLVASGAARVRSRVAAGDPAAPALPPRNLNQTVDETFDAGTEVAYLVWQQAGLKNWRALVWGGILWLAAFVIVVPIFIALVLSKIAVGALLGLAPFASVLYLYTPLRSLCQGYTRQLLTFAITPILVYSIVGMIGVTLDQIALPILAFVRAGGAPDTRFVAPYIIVAVVTGFLSLQTLSWASGIVGGVALSGSGAVSGVRTGAQLTAAGLLGGAKLANRLGPLLGKWLQGLGQSSGSQPGAPVRPSESWRVTFTPLDSSRALGAPASSGALPAGPSAPRDGGGLGGPRALGSGPKLLGPGPKLLGPGPSGAQKGKSS